MSFVAYSHLAVFRLRYRARVFRITNQLDPNHVFDHVSVEIQFIFYRLSEAAALPELLPIYKIRVSNYFECLAQLQSPIVGKYVQDLNL